MNRRLSQFLALLLIFPLIFLSLFCCCVLQTVHGQGVNYQVHQVVKDHSSSNHCDSREPQGQHPAPYHQCECPQLQGALAQSFDIFQAADVVFYSFNHQIILGEILLSFAPDSHKLLTEHSPPFSSAATPPYIKNSVLRI